MSCLLNKKLLILGGSALSCEIVKAANNLGVYTIVTDWYNTITSPAKLFADEYWDISIWEYDTLVKRILEEKVDGIITGFTDSYLLPYQHLCELTGLPCYATKEVFELTMDKARFKQLCRDNGVSVIPEYNVANFNPDIITEKNKVIIKPVDNSGSRGVVLCTKPEHFAYCLEYALSFSEKKQVVIEKYMEMDSISVSYTIQDGVLSLSTTDDRYVYKAESGSSVTQCSLYPSKYTEEYISKIDMKVRNMYKRAGIRNGVLSVQFFTDGHEFYVMEMGHRLTGGKHYNYTMIENGISGLDMLINFALTGKMAEYKIIEKDDASFKNTYCHLFILGKELSTISCFKGMDYLKQLPELTHFSLLKCEGQEIGTAGTASQKVVDMHLRVDDLAHLKRVMAGLEKNFHFYDNDGNDLTINFNGEIL